MKYLCSLLMVVPSYFLSVQQEATSFCTAEGQENHESIYSPSHTSHNSLTHTVKMYGVVETINFVDMHTSLPRLSSTSFLHLIWVKEHLIEYIQPKR